jgi:hypothetical protein
MPRGSSRPSHRWPLTREVLNRHDPAGLIALGCPPDEYDPELPDILEALQSAAAAPDPEPLLASALGRIFTDWFGPLPFTAWPTLAADLLHLSRSPEWSPPPNA